MKRALSALFLFTIFFSSATAQQQKLTSRLIDEINSLEDRDYVRTLVLLDDQVDIAAMDAQFYAENASIERRTLEVITALKEKAAVTQGGITDFLRDKEATDEVFRYHSYWAVNMIMVEAMPSVINELGARADIRMIDFDAPLSLDEPVDEQPAPSRNINGSEDGIKIINAHKLWEMGITGQGRTIMSIDTGVDVNHPALSYKWKGNNVPADQAWFDPAYGTTLPNDCDSHGTHVTGTMAGKVEGDTVGVAYDAEWIASNSLCGGGSHTSRTVASFEWAMDPDGDSTTIADMPDAISNSWYDPYIGSDCNSVYQPLMEAVEAVGIAVVFSAGNSGPGSQTITAPKNINTNEVSIWATGALDGDAYLSGSSDPIAYFSSRGTSTCGGTGSLLIKPEGVAPGVDVRSSVPGGGYGYKSGTSMASPHVAGAVALLKQFAPNLTGHQIKMALYNTAKDLGDPGEDNTYGMGLIDVYEAFLSLGDPDETPPEAITDLMVSEPTSELLKLTWTVPYDSSQGGIAEYDIRYSTEMITDTGSFNAAMPIEFPGQPGEYGETEMIMVEDLDFATTYYFAIRSGDVWGNISDISNVAMGATYGAPEIAVDPDMIDVTLPPGATTTESFDISNVTVFNSTLNYEISLENNTFPSGEAVKVKLVPKKSAIESVYSEKEKPVSAGGIAIEGAGGPDYYGYEWIDSDEPNGPDYMWNDISSTGTVADNWQQTGTYDPKDEGYAGPYSLGFDFNFYGETYSEVYFSSNGFITFEPLSMNSFSNHEIPNESMPNAVIAAVWDDLDGSMSGNIYYEQQGNKFVIQYDEWGEYSGSGLFTFQVVLSAGGSIEVHYNSLTGDIMSSTVGIENHLGDDGLQVAYNAMYLHDELAIKYSADPEWLFTNNMGGMLYNGNSATVELTFLTEDYPQGMYSMDVVINSNDPENSTVVVPVTMTLGQGMGESWTVDITTTEPGGLMRENSIGLHPLATDGIDSELGEVELPPAPPAGVFDTRMMLPDNLASMVDIRNSENEEVIFSYKFQAGMMGYPIVLHWDSESLPEGSFMIKDPFGGMIVNTDMKMTDSLVIENTSLSMLEIHYAKMMMMMMDFGGGWNLLSIPVHTPDMMVTSMFPEAVSPAYAFNGTYFQVDEFMMGSGYWLKFPEDTTHEMMGNPEPGNIALSEGWNLIGPYHMYMDPSMITTEPAGIITSAFFGFDNGYFNATSIDPGHGYWVKASQDGEIVMNYAAGKVNPNENDLAELARLIIRDAEGNSVTLYLGDKSGYEMPPVPPQGIFDARFSSGNMVESAISGADLQLNSAVYPVQISLDKGEVLVRDKIGGKFVNGKLSAGESIVITDNRITSVEISGTVIPEEFSLSQNYPNPFNPSTTISFSLPIESSVKMKIFNVIGEEVYSLKENVMEAGNHNVKFDASSLSSGIYFYSINVEGADGRKFSDIKKMILMK